MIGGSTGWNIQNSSGTLKFIYNSTTEASLSSGGILTCNGLPSLNLLSNVSISSLTTNQILQYNGTNWVNATIYSGTSTLAADTDCSISSPASNQALIYNGSKWNNAIMSHLNLSNIGTNSHAQIDTYISSFTSSISNLNMSTGIIKNNSSTTQNTPITTIYNDGTDGNIMYVNNLLPFYNKITGWNCNNNILSYTDSTQTSLKCTGLTGNASWVGFWSSGFSYCRWNLGFATPFQVNAITIVYSNCSSGSFNTTFYGSNTPSAFTDTGNDTTNLTALTATITNSIVTGMYTISTILSTVPYQYICLLATSITQYGQNGFSGLQIQSVGGGITTLTNNTDFTITSSTSNGAPSITYTDSTTNNLTYNLGTLLVSESYRRIYPVIHDTSNLFLSGGTGWNISSNSNSTNLCFNYNSSNKSYIDTSGNLYLNGNIL